MTLEERIAKRKAEGWTLSHWVVKSGDLYLNEGRNGWGPKWAAGGYAARDWPDDIVAKFSSTGETCRAVPVFTRTIKAKRRRTYSFWQACKMAMAGKKMRMCDPERDLVMTVGAVTRKVVWRVSAETVPVSEENINARWELAE